jgi:hypothetical protein
MSVVVVDCPRMTGTPGEPGDLTRGVCRPCSDRVTGEAIEGRLGTRVGPISGGEQPGSRGAVRCARPESESRPILS